MARGTICSVAICKSNFGRAKATGEHIAFYTFPKDPHIRDEWVNKCYRKDQFNPDKKRICSKHFRTEDYEDAIRARLMGYHPRKLKKNAVPSLLLLPDAQADKKAVASEKGKLFREVLIKAVARPPTPSNTESEDTTERQQEDSSEMDFEEIIIVTGAEDSSETEFEETIDQQQHSWISVPSTIEIPEDVLKPLRHLERENERLKKVILSHKDTERSLKERISNLEKQLEEANAGFEEKAITAFKGFLTKNQIEIALRKKRKARRTRKGFSR